MRELRKNRRLGQSATNWRHKVGSTKQVTPRPNKERSRANPGGGELDGYKGLTAHCGPITGMDHIPVSLAWIPWIPWFLQ